MTLIIGCKTPEYGIIAGDTQLTTNGLLKYGESRRSIQLKINKYSTDLIFGILGKWNYFYAAGKGKAVYIDEYVNLQKGISKPKVKNKLDFLKDYLVGKKDIEATAIYINKKENDFELNVVSNNGDDKYLNNIKSENKQLLFNEPFYNYHTNYVKELISNFIEEYKIDDSLTDNIFLLNNIILQIISEGNELNISNKNVFQMGINNTVGGYVTIQIISKKILILITVYTVLIVQIMILF